MSDTYTCSDWCCTDCPFLLAEMNETETAEWLAEISRRSEGYEITLGMPRESHFCLDENGQTAGNNGNEYDCEVYSFS